MCRRIICGAGVALWMLTVGGGEAWSDEIRACGTKTVPVLVRSAVPVLVRSAWSPGKLWEKGTVLRVRFLGGSDHVQKMVKKYALQWTECCGIRLEFGTDVPSDIRISFESGKGSWSCVGTDARHAVRRLVTVPETMRDRIALVIEASHRHPLCAVGASPRAAQALLRGCMARAALDGRNVVGTEDLSALAFPILNHRIVLTREAHYAMQDKDPVAEMRRIIDELAALRAEEA